MRKKVFNPPTCQCKKCDTVLRSRWEGHFVRCECGESFVDQTRYYSRYGGEVESVEELLKKEFAALYFGELLQEFLDQNPEME
jgi:CXCXC repeat